MNSKVEMSLLVDKQTNKVVAVFPTTEDTLVGIEDTRYKLIDLNSQMLQGMIKSYYNELGKEFATNFNMDNADQC